MVTFVLQDKKTLEDVCISLFSLKLGIQCLFQKSSPTGLRVVVFPVCALMRNTHPGKLTGYTQRMIYRTDNIPLCVCKFLRRFSKWPTKSHSVIKWYATICARILVCTSLVCFNTVIFWMISAFAQTKPTRNPGDNTLEKLPQKSRMPIFI